MIKFKKAGLALCLFLGIFATKAFATPGASVQYANKNVEAKLISYNSISNSTPDTIEGLFLLPDNTRIHYKGKDRKTLTVELIPVSGKTLYGEAVPVHEKEDIYTALQYKFYIYADDGKTKIYDGTALVHLT